VFGWPHLGGAPRNYPARKEPLIRAYSRLCAKLAAVGMPRLAHEGADDYAARVAQDRPDLGPAVIAPLPALLHAALRGRLPRASPSVNSTPPCAPSGRMPCGNVLAGGPAG